MSNRHIAIFIFASLMLHPVPGGAMGLGELDTSALYHTTDDAFYKFPGTGDTEFGPRSGAVSLGTDLGLRIRTARDNVDSVGIRVWDPVSMEESFNPMSIHSSDGSYDYWEGKISSPDTPQSLSYYFVINKDGKEISYLDTNEVGKNLHGKGVVLDGLDARNKEFQVLFYDESFAVPSWHSESIGYQIFPDRFYNGDESNDAIGDDASGDVLWWEWDSTGNGIIDGNDIGRIYASKKAWTDPPERGYPYGNDWFGGDIQGIMDKVDYLKELGIGFLWLNPITNGPSNHGYHVSNYTQLHPYFGVIDKRENGVVYANDQESLELFREFIELMHNNSIKVFFDAVVNHVGAQSPYFQRFDYDINAQIPDLYPDIDGAYESTSSPYYDFFKFYDYNHNYENWFGFAPEIPIVQYTPTKGMGEGSAEYEMILKEGSVFDFWNDLGIDGWRLDAAGHFVDGEDGHYINRKIREEVKENDPNDVFISEAGWDTDLTQYMDGTMMDGDQFMQFMFETKNWLVGTNPGYKGFLKNVQESFPNEYLKNMWGLLSNHDVERVLNSLDMNKDLVKLAVTLQMTYVATPVIYYGDEIGMEGDGDPGSRATFTWDAMDTDLLDTYKSLINIRKSNPVFTRGGFELLDTGKESVLGYFRDTSDPEFKAAMVLVNRNDEPKSITLYAADSIILSPEQEYTGLLDNSYYKVDSDGLLTLELGAHSALILITTDIPSTGATINRPSDSSGIPLSASWLASLILVPILLRRRQK